MEVIALEEINIDDIPAMKRATLGPKEKSKSTSINILDYIEYAPQIIKWERIQKCVGENELLKCFFDKNAVDKVTPFCETIHWSKFNRRGLYEYFKEKNYKLIGGTFASHVFNERNNVLIVRKDDLLLSFESNGESGIIKFLYNKFNEGYKNEVDFICENFGEKEEGSQISLLIKEYGELTLSKFQIKSQPLDYSNYNDDFKQVNDKVIEFLNNEKSGIVLLHGDPGTGKTSYIRSLSELTERDLVYTTKNIAEVFDSPDFLGFAMRELKGKVLILEDIESVLQVDGARSGATSNILALSDGLLADLLQLKIIATFNTDLENIDKAIRRKGRMVLRHEFKKLTLDKTNSLLKKLGRKESKTELTLAECYNEEDNGGEVKQERLGF